MKNKINKSEIKPKTYSYNDLLSGASGLYESDSLPNTLFLVVPEMNDNIIIIIRETSVDYANPMSLSNTRFFRSDKTVTLSNNS